MTDKLKVLEKKARSVGTVNADAVARNKDGCLLFMRGYFYRNGTAEDFADRISKALTAENIPHRVVNVYDQWKPFRGGDSIRKGSHFGVKIRILADV